MTAGRDRRPLAVREVHWIKALARRIARTQVTPNQISRAGLAAALLSGLCFAGSGVAAGPARVILLLVAGALILLRILCNLLDGMVAIEGGKAGSAGRFWNEVPDRISDMSILVGAGIGAGAASLGWAAACFALFTAYLRELGVALGTTADFRGPMAKPHRMAVIAVAAALECLAAIWRTDGIVLQGALWIIVLGAAVTSVRRARRLLSMVRT